MENDVPNMEESVANEKPKRKVTRAKTSSVESADSTVEAKPKRTRRTKAQIEADRAAEEAAKAAALAAGIEVKPKRTRRTKAQIEADRAAEEAAKAASDMVATDTLKEEETPVKPKRTRRTKAQIEADKAAEAAEKAAKAKSQDEVAQSTKPVENNTNLELLLKLAQQAKDSGTIDEATLHATLAALQKTATATNNNNNNIPAAEDADDIGNRVSFENQEVANDFGNKSATIVESSLNPQEAADEADNSDSSKKPRKSRERATLSPAERSERRARVLAERKAAEARRAREKEERDKFLSFLALAFPKAIFIDREQRLPLKVGIAQDILDRLEGMEAQYKYFDKQRYKILHNYCHSLPYLQKIADGVPRVDLDGNPAGEIEQEHRDNAKEEIERIRKEIEAATAKAKKVRKGGKRPMPNKGGPRLGGNPRFNQQGGPRQNFNRSEGYQGRSGGYQQGNYQKRSYQQGGGYAQGGNNYQQGGYQQGGYQQDGYQQGGYQKRSYQQGGYQSGGSGYQNRYQNNGYQNRYQSNAQGHDSYQGQGNNDSSGPKVMRRRVFKINKDQE